MRPAPVTAGGPPVAWWAQQNRAWLRDLAPGSRVALLFGSGPGSLPERGYVAEVGGDGCAGAAAGGHGEEREPGGAGRRDKAPSSPRWEPVGSGFPWGRADVAFVAPAAIWAAVAEAGPGAGDEFRRLVRAGRVVAYVLAPPERLRAQGFDEALTRLGVPFPGACAG